MGGVSVRLACPMMCGGKDSVALGGGLEVWCGPTGKPGEYVRGQCSHCMSEVLVAPSMQAVEWAAKRLSAARELASEQR